MQPVTIKLTNTKVPMILEHIEKLPKDGSLQIVISDYDESRSRAQNALSHLWYSYIHKENGWSQMYVKCFCKYTIGRHVVGEYYPHLVDKFKLILDPLSFEDKINAMELIELTSILGVKAMRDYLDRMEMYWTDKGIHLPHPENYKLAMSLGRASK